jgi:hypothetical protein
MKSIADELEKIIDDSTPSLKEITGEQFSLKESPGKWSKKEILGHLIDSAQNNIRRFVVAQYEETPKITYNQDKWVAISDYQLYKTDNLINLWILLNKHVCQILRNISPEMAQRESETEAVHTIEWLAQDYNKHLLHHLHQVLDLEPIPY